jgi:hypothetical protein
MLRRTATLAFTLLALLATTGCGRVREISACRSLAREVNPLLAEVEALSKRPGGRDELALAKRYAELAKRVKAQSARGGALEPALRDYAGVFEATDVALRGHQEATRQNQAARIAEKRRDLDRLVKRERAAVARIEGECQS